MKRIFVSLSFMLVVGSTTVFAGDETEVNGKTYRDLWEEYVHNKCIYKYGKPL